MYEALACRRHGGVASVEMAVHRESLWEGAPLRRVSYITGAFTYVLLACGGPLQDVLNFAWKR